MRHADRVGRTYGMHKVSAVRTVNVAVAVAVTVAWGSVILRIPVSLTLYSVAIGNYDWICWLASMGRLFLLLIRNEAHRNDRSYRLCGQRFPIDAAEAVYVLCIS